MSCLTPAPNVFTYFESKPELLLNQDFGRAYLYDFAVGIPILQPIVGLVGGSFIQITNPYLTTVKLKRKRQRNKETFMNMDLWKSNPRRYPQEVKSFKFKGYPDGSLKRIIKCSDLKYGQVASLHPIIHKCCKCNIKKKIDNRSVGHNQLKKVYCCPCKQNKVNKKTIFPRTCGLAKDLLKSDCKSITYRQPSFKHHNISKRQCSIPPHEEGIFDEIEAANNIKMERQAIRNSCSY